MNNCVNNYSENKCINIKSKIKKYILIESIDFILLK